MKQGDLVKHIGIVKSVGLVVALIAEYHDDVWEVMWCDGSNGVHWSNDLEVINSDSVDVKENRTKNVLDNQKQTQ